MIVLHKMLTRLLLLDKPVPYRTDEEALAEAQRNYRWNFVMNLLDGGTFWFGIAFASSATIVPLFVSKITLNPLVIGLVAMIAQSSWFLPQLFAAGLTERVDRKKPIVVNAGFFLERVPVWLWPAAALVAAQWPITGLILFLLTYAWHGFGAGLLGPAWQDLIARCFPVNRRGTVFGLTSFIGTGVGALGALVSSRILAQYAYPWNFFLVFLTAAIAINLSWVFIALIREPEQRSVDHEDSRSGTWGRMWRVVRRDSVFRNFLAYRVMMVSGAMGTGFITVTAVQRWALQDSIVGYFTAVLLLGQTVGSLLAGMLADRYGHKTPLVFGGLAQVSGFTLALTSPAPEAFFTVFAMVGLSMGIHMVSGTLVALEFSEPSRRPTYVGIANTTAGVAGSVAPLLGGWLASLGYQLLFAACVAVGVAALAWLLVGVRDPRSRKPRAAALA
jgi:MFS family permease